MHTHTYAHENTCACMTLSTRWSADTKTHNLCTNMHTHTHTHVSQLNWHVYASPSEKNHAELVDNLFNFVSHISNVPSGVKVSLEPWTLKYALAFAEKNEKQKLITPKSTPLVEGGLARLLDAVRCFSYAQQLIFYTETLHITDVTHHLIILMSGKWKTFCVE